MALADGSRYPHPGFDDDTRRRRRRPAEVAAATVELPVRRRRTPDGDPRRWPLYDGGAGLPSPTEPTELDVPFLASGWHAFPATMIDEPLPPFAIMPLPMTAVKGYQPDPRPSADAIPGGGQAAPAQPVATRTAFGTLEPPPL